MAAAEEFKLISRIVKLCLFNTYISMRMASVKHFTSLHKAYIFKWDFVRWVNSKLGKLKHKTDCSTLSLFYEAFVGNAWWSFLPKSSYFPILYFFGFLCFRQVLVSVVAYKSSKITLFHKFLQKTSEEKFTFCTPNHHTDCPKCLKPFTFLFKWSHNICFQNQLLCLFQN